MKQMRVCVQCARQGQVIKTYDFSVPSSLAAAPSYDPKELIDVAKSNLTTEGIAEPPYADIEFKIRSG